MAWTFGLRLIAAGVALAAISACGVSGATGEAPETPSFERITQPLTTPPAVEGTYRGSFTEKENGKTYTGTLRMVVHEHNFKISGPFHVRGGTPHKLDTAFVGKVRASGDGAELRFTVPWLGGYDVDVKVRASVVAGNLTGTGRGSWGSQRNYQRWTFKAAKS